MQQQEHARDDSETRHATRNEPSPCEPTGAERDERHETEIGCDQCHEPERRHIDANSSQPVDFKPRKQNANESADRPQKHCPDRGHQRARFCGLNVCHGEPAKNELLKNNA
ncbi:hypothetical protein [Bradyrhizobium sp. URHA0013]|uniref:hypothetical protein n=1 Tax=Bradyrhizobium sp. URHA0013 TaxID=1380352 RepID=UPI0012DED219|nr:hypothetical protein [Bradyrhizobium sp. URHA0013]